MIDAQEILAIPEMALLIAIGREVQHSLEVCEYGPSRCACAPLKEIVKRAERKLTEEPT